MKLAPDRTRPAAFARHLVDPDTTALTVECKTCGESYTARRFICPDPQARAWVGCERMAATWLSSHPCFLTTATQRRRAA